MIPSEKTRPCFRPCGFPWGFCAQAWGSSWNLDFGPLEEHFFSISFAHDVCNLICFLEVRYSLVLPKIMLGSADLALPFCRCRGIFSGTACHQEWEPSVTQGILNTFVQGGSILGLIALPGWHSLSVAGTSSFFWFNARSVEYYLYFIITVQTFAQWGYDLACSARRGFSRALPGAPCPYSLLDLCIATFNSLIQYNFISFCEGRLEYGGLEGATFFIW